MFFKTTRRSIFILEQIPEDTLRSYGPVLFLSKLGEVELVKSFLQMIISRSASCVWCQCDCVKIFCPTVASKLPILSNKGPISPEKTSQRGLRREISVCNISATSPDNMTATSSPRLPSDIRGSNRDVVETLASSRLQTGRHRHNCFKPQLQRDFSVSNLFLLKLNVCFPCNYLETPVILWRC